MTIMSFEQAEGFLDLVVTSLEYLISEFLDLGFIFLLARIVLREVELLPGIAYLWVFDRCLPRSHGERMETVRILR